MPSLIINITLNQQVSALNENNALTDHRTQSPKTQENSNREPRQATRLLTAPMRELIAEYHRHHPLSSGRCLACWFSPCRCRKEGAA